MVSLLEYAAKMRCVNEIPLYLEVFAGRYSSLPHTSQSGRSCVDGVITGRYSCPVILLIAGIVVFDSITTGRYSIEATGDKMLLLEDTAEPRFPFYK